MEVGPAAGRCATTAPALSQPQARAPADHARARSLLYVALARAFAFPQPDFHREVLSGRWLEEVTALCGQLPYRLSPGAGRSWHVPADYDRFQSEYIRLFEVGPRGVPPCPLHGGHYRRDRLRTMEELIRFYNFFGLRLARGKMPDHVTVELEFMHYLAFREGEPDTDAESYRRAQRDFLDRHLGRWLPLAAQGLRAHRPPPFYRSLAAFACRFVQAEREHLRRSLSSAQE